MFSGSVVHFGVVLVATVVLSLLVSAVSYAVVEDPGRRYAHRQAHQTLRPAPRSVAKGSFQSPL